MRACRLTSHSALLAGLAISLAVMTTAGGVGAAARHPGVGGSNVFAISGSAQRIVVKLTKLVGPSTSTKDIFGDLVQAPAGHRFYVVRLAYRNTGQATIKGELAPSEKTVLVDASGGTWTYGDMFFTSPVKKGPARPGGTATASLTFDVGTTAQVAAFRLKLEARVFSAHVREWDLTKTAI